MHSDVPFLPLLFVPPPPLLWTPSAFLAFKVVLASSTRLHSNALFSFMASLLRTENTDCDPLLLWIFPDSRPRTHRSLDSPLHLVLKAMDHLPHKFDDIFTNLSTCLMLPLSAMVNSPPSHPPYRQSWRDLKVNHLYQIDHNLDVLMPIAPARPLPRFITLNHILQRLLDHSLVAHPILFRAYGSPFDFDPFISALVFGKPWSRLSTRSYWLTCSHHHANAQPLSPHLSPRQLHSFWSFTLPHQARNVWFRGLHNKLSCRALLHHIMPFTVPSPLCNICQMSIEMQEHFLLSCPLKSAVWLGIWLEFLSTVPPPSALSLAFTSFLFPPTLNPSIPAALVFGLTILAIWDYHWTLHFNSAPFLPFLVLATARKSISRICSEHELDSADSSLA
ncbi:hypothetical protein PHYBLDRAFT_144960 [Phycomyces blakesleeanus NRRL 1555(-)]|uniref:Reverse transcriptase zinc-binding domain-containing protein n=1 Tax=Phycomyces blakesleeanus (strain ATCC 8743b / DSM 1359 / FGSC 10004 / NBRC 33097 / NRRL 1555) TaxID=763407 RepID=A0A167MYH5_PHYB8|nr:hypothetical protein PHYBLDRAFT_144960 [Phycomyces blakesleeanus NRRL 1555(-)]OAD74519.1 hypothetical protein PHYBLDRAFT_144960 [Phycomyces blakesleeanus NRRL 1555(-)]|eukprot:XP_018292559.1 hypothetical protein PHYBLDRAFT_144960 [Phycomyces blakesleeanus NRRL 1555(-)]